MSASLEKSLRLQEWIQEVNQLRIEGKEPFSRPSSAGSSPGGPPPSESSAARSQEQGPSLRPIPSWNRSLPYIPPDCGSAGNRTCNTCLLPCSLQELCECLCHSRHPDSGIGSSSVGSKSRKRKMTTEDISFNSRSSTAISSGPSATGINTDSKRRRNNFNELAVVNNSVNEISGQNVEKFLKKLRPCQIMEVDDSLVVFCAQSGGNGNVLEQGMNSPGQGSGFSFSIDEMQKQQQQQRSNAKKKQESFFGRICSWLFNG